MTRTVRAIVLVGALVALALSLAAPVAVAAGHDVQIAGFAFSPDPITIRAGDSVTWSNQDGVGHTATADDGSFDTGTISAGSSKTVAFSTVGTFAYHCAIHASMRATVVVEDATSAPATDTAPGVSPLSRGPGWLVLALAAIVGVAAARRRFGGGPAGR